jgi:hypothetical protein
MLNEKICLAGGSNTGFGECYLNPKNIVGFILAPLGSVITEADAGDFGAFLESKINAANPAERWYPVHGFEAVTDNTEDVTIETMGYGGKGIVREGDYDLLFRWVVGGMCLQKSLRKFNNTNMGVFLIDADGMLFGTTVNGEMQAIPLVLFYTNPWRVNDGSTSTVYGVRIVFRPRPVNEDLAFLDVAAMGFVLSSFKGLQNMSLVVLDPENAPITNIRVVSGCNRGNLYAEYSTELAAPDLWRASKVSDDSPIVISTVTANSGLEAMTVTVADGASDYFVRLVNPEALAAAGIVGYDSQVVKVVVDGATALARTKNLGKPQKDDPKPE